MQYWTFSKRFLDVKRHFGLGRVRNHKPRTSKRDISTSPIDERALILKHPNRLRNMAFAFVVSLIATGPGYSEEMPPSWLPDAIILPDDAEVMMNREVGSSIRMLSFKTQSDVTALFQGWPTALEERGYDIRPQQLDIDTAMIEFSGNGILNAKISTGAETADNWVTVTFDATLD